MKQIIILITITMLVSCSNTQTQAQKQIEDSSEIFSENEIKYFKEMLEGYKNVDYARFEEAKQHSIETAKLDDENEDTAELEKYLDNNLIRVDSIVDACFDLLKNKQYRNMAVLLDENKASFYSHSSTSVELLYMFISTLDALYMEFYPEDEAISKMIEIHGFSSLYNESIYRLNNNREDALHYYFEDLNALEMLYKLSGNYQKQIECLEEIGKMANSESYEQVQESLAKARENLKMQNSTN